MMPVLEITAPTIEYALLLPFILIFAAACLGVGVEAFAPRSMRRPIQLLLTFGSIVVALLVLVINWSSGKGEAITAVGSVALDGPTYFMWGILLVLGGVSLLVFDERKLDGASVFTPQASAVPGSPAEQEALAARVEHTEVFPLALFALSGMMLFPASNDLITMF